MDAFTPAVTRMMKRLYQSLRENDRRRYAAIEAKKLGHGGIKTIARLLGCDPQTVRQGIAELEAEDELDPERVRKKGVDENG
jgi:Mn-dependent DtxR family transcriptional regulator